MWDVIVLIPDHCLSIHFKLLADRCDFKPLSFSTLIEHLYSLDNGVFFNYDV